MIERLARTHNFREIQDRRERSGMSVLIIDGCPWTMEPWVADKLEEHLNEQSNSEKRASSNARSGE